MIYSEDINKICALCVFAEPKDNTEDELFCSRRKKNTAATNSGCKKFKYDIFKKTVRRKKRLKTDFSPEDFTL